jgi:hypothetical protein
MTADVDKYYSVTVSLTEKIGPRRWRSMATIFRRDTHKMLETFYTEGGAKTSASRRAINEGKRKANIMGIPSDWQGDLL